MALVYFTCCPFTKLIPIAECLSISTLTRRNSGQIEHRRITSWNNGKSWKVKGSKHKISKKSCPLYLLLILLFFIRILLIIPLLVLFSFLSQSYDWSISQEEWIRQGTSRHQRLLFHDDFKHFLQAFENIEIDLKESYFYFRNFPFQSFFTLLTSRQVNLDFQIVGATRIFVIINCP